MEAQFGWKVSVFTQDFLEELKGAISVPELFRQLGFQEIEKPGMYRCPFHDDRKPSLSIHENYFNCFSPACRARGDGFALVRLVKGCSFPTAVRYVQDIYNEENQC